ncbi:AmmeMemoRadiSam system radical SAM enzyme [Tissierella creatinini]|nr:AmmeMemoRadiSam system radical SAM enzyme [Tissierella creatinini]TJX60644.1 AmmeMemoRadiSam system radical SAM enzyme [Soehngenia saccharolytica]
MKEAILYKQIEGLKVKCAVCNMRCTIPEGHRGLCGVRENRGGKLYALNYGKTIAVNVDPIEKKPLYHFMPKTKIYSFAAVGCNFRCSWCQNWEISQSPKPNKRIEGIEISPLEHVDRAIEYKCPSIAYTYSEPTIFLEYAFDTMKIAKEKGLKNVWVTNGYMSTETLDLIIPYLDATNVDYKGPNGGVYEKYCGGKPIHVLENLKYLYKAGVHLEITTLIVPGVNDKPDHLKQIAKFIAEELSKDVPWHISRFFPAWKMKDTIITPLETLKTAEKIGQEEGLTHIHIGNV